MLSVYNCGSRWGVGTNRCRGAGWASRIPVCERLYVNCVLYNPLSVLLLLFSSFLCFSVKLPFSRPASYAFFFRFFPHPAAVGGVSKRPRGSLLGEAKPWQQYKYKYKSKSFCWSDLIFVCFIHYGLANRVMLQPFIIKPTGSLLWVFSCFLLVLCRRTEFLPSLPFSL